MLRLAEQNFPPSIQNPGSEFSREEQEEIKRGQEKPKERSREFNNVNIKRSRMFYYQSDLGEAEWAVYESRR